MDTALLEESFVNFLDCFPSNLPRRRRVDAFLFNVGVGRQHAVETFVVGCDCAHVFGGQNDAFDIEIFLGKGGQCHFHNSNMKMQIPLQFVSILV